MASTKLPCQSLSDQRTLSDGQSRVLTPTAGPVRKRKKKATTRGENDWNAQKTRIMELHIKERRPLPEVCKIMQDRYDFTATIRQYRKCISNWDLDKNLKPDEMRAIVRKRQRRRLVETSKRDLVFEVRGVIVPQQKIDRYMKRNKIPENELYHPDSAPTTPAAVSYETESEPDSPTLGSGFGISSPQSPRSPSSYSSVVSQIAPSLSQSNTDDIRDFLQLVLFEIFMCDEKNLIQMLVEHIGNLLLEAHRRSQEIPPGVPFWGSIPDIARSISGVLREQGVYLVNSHIGLSQTCEWKFYPRWTNAFIGTKRTVLPSDPTFEKIMVRVYIIPPVGRCWAASVDTLAKEGRVQMPLIDSSIRQSVPSAYNAPAFLAARVDDYTTLRELFESRQATVFDINPTTIHYLIGHSAWYGSYAVTTYLLDQGATTHDAYRGRHSILWAIWLGFFERRFIKSRDEDNAMSTAVDLSFQFSGLLSFNPPVDAHVDASAQIPIDIAADILNCTAMSRLALRYGCMIEDCTHLEQWYGNLLHIPCRFEYSSVEYLDEVVKHMLAIGSDIEYRNHLGHTPLLQTAKSGGLNNSPYLHTLIQNGADVNATDSEGRGALHLTLLSLNENILYARLPDVESKLVILLSAGCEPYKVDKWQRTPARYIESTSALSIWKAALQKAGKKHLYRGR